MTYFTSGKSTSKMKATGAHWLLVLHWWFQTGVTQLDQAARRHPNKWWASPSSAPMANAKGQYWWPEIKVFTLVDTLVWSLLSLLLLFILKTKKIWNKEFNFYRSSSNVYNSKMAINSDVSLRENHNVSKINNIPDVKVLSEVWTEFFLFIWLRCCENTMQCCTYSECYNDRKPCSPNVIRKKTSLA